MEVKNLLIIYDYSYVNGGAARVAIQSAVAMAENNNMNVYYFSAVGPVCNELIDSKVKVINLGMSDINGSNKICAMLYGIWNVKSKKKLKECLKENKLTPEETIIHIHGVDKALSSSIFSVINKYKVFITVHEYSVFCPNGGLYNYKKQCACKLSPMGVKCVICNCDKRNYLQKIWRMIRQLIKNWVIRRCDLVLITISELNELLVKKYLPGRRIVRIPDTIANYSKRIPIKEDNFNYIFVGRISEEKGVDIFCDAIQSVKKKYPYVSGTVVGDGANRSKLSKKFHMINFVGWQDENGVYEYIANARMLVFPSRCYETAGLTVLESLSIGTPCIVGSNTAAKEFIIENYSGLLFETNNIQDLVSTIERSLDNDLINKMNIFLQDEYDSTMYKESRHIKMLNEVYNN